MIRIYISLLFCLCILSCQQDQIHSELDSSDSEDVVMESLPLITAAIQTLPSNWTNAKSIQTNPFGDDDFEIEEGEGIFVCRSNGDHLNTGIEHGDIELDIEFMVPKGSNSGIYFQGRYEVQILDSWGKSTITNQDCGSIYESYDEEKKSVIHSGSAPKVNSSKAPGLWQSFNILFRAPRFDADGKKIANAKFEHVIHNGHLIQKDVEVPTPTRAHMLEGEAPTGPIMIQGDHGQVAFRHMKFKKMGKDEVGISKINYQMYDRKMDYIPDFDTMTVAKSGTVDNFDKLEDLAGQQDGFAFIFNADIDIPKDGDYLFSTMLDDGGDLYIDDKLVVHNLGEPGIGTERGLITLNKGIHKLKLTYFEEVWLALAVIFVEGPEMPKQTLASTDITKIWGSGGNKDKILIDARDEVEVLRGYIIHDNGKETHALSVGDPDGVHYSYDLMDGTPLRAWKGEFADVTNMWKNRGQSQLLLPRNAVIEFKDGVPIGPSSRTQLNKRPENYKNKGYRLDGSGRPIFLSSLGDIDIEDSLSPSSEGHLERQTRIAKGSGESLWLHAAIASSITEISKGLVSIDDDYYIKMSSDTNYDIKNSNSSNDQLLISLENDASYEIIW